MTSWAVGLHVCCSGLSRELRESLQALIEAAGGLYHRNLSRSVTHLVVSDDLSRTSSEKYAVAIANKTSGSWASLHIVSLRWVIESSKRASVQQEALYAPNDVGTEPLSEQQSIVLLAAQYADGQSPPSPTEDAQLFLPSSSRPEKIQEATQTEEELQHAPPFALTQHGFLPFCDLINILGKEKQESNLIDTGKISAFSPPRGRRKASEDSDTPATIMTPPCRVKQAISELVAQLQNLEPATALPHLYGPFADASPSHHLEKDKPSSSQNVSVSQAHVPSGEGDAPVECVGTTTDDTHGSYIFEFEKSRHLAANAILRLPSGSREDRHLEAQQMMSMRHQPVQDVPAPCYRDAPYSGIFADMMVSIDDTSVSDEEKHAVLAALEGGGATVIANTGVLVKNCYVVSLPEYAFKYLSLGLSVVSPDWVLHSVKQGTAQRRLAMSADISRLLRLDSYQANISQGPKPFAIDGQSNVSLVQLSVAKAREDLLQKAISCNTPRPKLPASMLTNIAWAIRDSPSSAVAEPSDHALIVPESDGEDIEIFGDAPGVSYPEQGLITASQTAVHVTLHDLSRQETRNEVLNPFLKQVLLWESRVTLIFPSDATGALPCTCATFDLPNGTATGFDILNIIYAHYQGTLTLAQQLEMLRGAGGMTSPQLQRLQTAFLRGVSVQAWELLGSRVMLEGLFKVSRHPSASVYEIRLTG